MLRSALVQPTPWPTSGRVVFAVQTRLKHGGKETGGSRPNRVSRGLYGGKGKQSGNHVSFSINRVRRTWSPNVHAQSLYSELLDCKLPFRATTHVLRTIDKLGGLDNYLLRTSDAKLDSDVATDAKRLLEARLLQLERAGAAIEAPGGAAPAARLPLSWSPEEDKKLAHLCQYQGTHRKMWLRKSLQLGTDRTPEAVKVRWRTRLHPSVAEKQGVVSRMKAERSERRITWLQERFPGCDRMTALTALRRHGDPGASYAKKLWGRAVGELQADGRFAEVSVTQLAAAADAAEASESSEERSSYA